MKKHKKYRYVFIWLINFIAIDVFFILLFTTFPFQGHSPMPINDLKGWIIFSIGAIIAAFRITDQIKNDDKNK